MSKTQNTKQRSEQIQTIARGIIDQKLHDSLPLDACKPLRVAWQHQLIAETGCTPFTARSHIAKALRRARHDGAGS